MGSGPGKCLHLYTALSDLTITAISFFLSPPTMDVNMEVLLELCESNIKSLARLLPTLHSIDALKRLEEKADVIEAFSIIASFSSILLPPTPPSTINESVETRLERLERRTDVLEGARSEGVGGGRRGGSMAFAHTHTSVHPSPLEDGRDADESGNVPLRSQSTLRTPTQPAPLAHLLHPVRQTETYLTRKDEPLYSFLVHFPVFSALGAKLSVVERAELFSDGNPAMAKWGFADGMTTRAYPRLRLTNGGTAFIVVDENLKRLESIRTEFEAMQQALWNEAYANTLDRKLFIVGTWSEEHVFLLFSVSYAFGGRPEPIFERLTTSNALWSDILGIHPILSQYQEASSTKEGGGPLLGARLFHRARRVKLNPTTERHLLMLFVPFLWCPHSRMFAHDFAARHPTIVIGGGDRKHTFNVRVLKLGPPARADNSSWDGPVLVAHTWQDEVDREFDPSICG